MSDETNTAADDRADDRTGGAGGARPVSRRDALRVEHSKV